jgi:RNA polymerase-binding transcription factor DksA
VSPGRDRDSKLLHSPSISAQDNPRPLVSTWEPHFIERKEEAESVGERISLRKDGLIPATLVAGTGLASSSLMSVRKTETPWFQHLFDSERDRRVRPRKTHIIEHLQPLKRSEGERFDDATSCRIRQRLMQKGCEIATLLADVLSGKNRESELRALPVHDKPGERPEEKLRRYLELIESRRRLLDAGDDAYGRCDVCGVDLGATALDEMPWADRCLEHAATKL